MESKEYQSNESIVELLSTVSSFNELSEFMQDEQLDRALELIVKILYRKGNPDAKMVPQIIAELQALATIFAIKSAYYATISKGRSEETKKKNVYYTAKDHVSRLADALKYLMK